MLSPRSSPRTTSQTFDAWPARKTVRLPGRVAATDDHGGAVRAEGRLDRRRGVMDAAALEVLEARHVELPVARARREQDRAGLDALAVAEVNGVVEALLERDRDRLAGEDDRRAELPRLDRRPLRELPAGEARGEAQVVLDPGRRCRLPAGGDRFQRHRREPLRRAVDRGGETRRPGADHEQVGHRFHPPRPAQPERRCQLRVRGVPQHDLAAADHDRRLLGRDLELPAAAARRRHRARGRSRSGECGCGRGSRAVASCRVSGSTRSACCRRRAR